MKKLLFVALFIVAAFQLKAQQVSTFKSADSLLKKAVAGNFKQPTTVKPFVIPQFNLATLNFAAVESRMPVIVLDGNSKMPIVKLGGYYTMPVKRIGTAEPLVTEKKVLPGLPTFAAPVMK